jgi:DNA-directed RNA polymerase specialized sigma24 family protein
VAERLHQRHARSVFLACVELLGSPKQAADATHEVFARALPLLPQNDHVVGAHC